MSRRKHGFPLSIDEAALPDPLAVSTLDMHPEGDRWTTVCRAKEGTPLFVVHTWPDKPREAGRIISARKATSHERRGYENG
ncbi:BrnT family toxin [Pararhodospirillum oryzae]|uniref:BrnT family toxin n=1 Tax=Pararhodospirillum oryzae TaxID=478448 RepID=UPI0011BFA24E|nr:BrnT family toxin [Pararhodospirillum oryzae]